MRVHVQVVGRAVSSVGAPSARQASGVPSQGEAIEDVTVVLHGEIPAQRAAIYRCALTALATYRGAAVSLDVSGQ